MVSLLGPRQSSFLMLVQRIQVASRLKALSFQPLLVLMGVLAVDPGLPVAQHRRLWRLGLWVQKTRCELQLHPWIHMKFLCPGGQILCCPHLVLGSWQVTAPEARAADPAVTLGVPTAGGL